MQIGTRLTELLGAFNTLVCSGQRAKARKQAATGSLEGNGYSDVLNGPCLLPSAESSRKAKSKTRTLEQLPHDILGIILSKLAFQDPASFIDATYACRVFEALASDRRLDLWKRICHSHSQPLGDTEKARAFKIAVCSFGGYESVVKARWNERTPADRSAFRKMRSFLGSKRSPPTRTLFLVRSPQGELLMWAVFKNGITDPSAGINWSFGMKAPLQLLMESSGIEEGIAGLLNGDHRASIIKDQHGSAVLLESYLQLISGASAPVFLRGPDAIRFQLFEPLAYDAGKMIGFNGAKIISEHAACRLAGNVSVSFFVSADLDISSNIGGQKEENGTLQVRSSNWRFRFKVCYFIDPADIARKFVDKSLRCDWPWRLMIDSSGWRDFPVSSFPELPW